jgi:hypothetical protein
VADRKGSGVKLSQPPKSSSMPNRGLTKPKFLQLHPPHHPVLPISHLRNRPLQIASPRNLTYIASFGGLGVHARSVTGRGARVVRRSCRLSKRKAREIVPCPAHPTRTGSYLPKWEPVRVGCLTYLRRNSTLPSV